jgi:hypothetical protein
MNEHGPGLMAVCMYGDKTRLLAPNIINVGIKMESGTWKHSGIILKVTNIIYKKFDLLSKYALLNNHLYSYLLIPSIQKN